jgi:hypothetical protein
MAKRGRRLRGFLWRTLLRLTADGNSARRCPTAAAEVACDGGDGSGVGQGEENGRKKRGLGSACWCRGGREGGGGSGRCGWVARRGGGGPAEVGPMRGEGGWRQRHSVMQGRGRGDARWGLVAVRGEN